MGQVTDKSGPSINSWLLAYSGFDAKVLQTKCVPDDQNLIRDVLIDCCDDTQLDVILTTGGTGFASRDNTPEATKAVIEKEAPGMVIAMIKGSLDVTPMAMLSRLACGIRGKTLIVNLPGSKKAALECLEIIAPSLPHAVDLLKDNKTAVQSMHQAVQQEHYTSVPLNGKDSCTHHHLSDHSHDGMTVKSDITKVAYRLRKSPYPAIPVSEALNIVLKSACVSGTETISHSEGLERILAEDIFAADPLPPFPASIKDGYAVIASDGCGIRKVVSNMDAGSKPDETVLTSQHCIRINTGAPVPLGADAVVQVEDTRLVSEADEGRTELEVEILIAPLPGRDIRPIGSDIAKGEKVLTCGTKLGYAELGILATVGITDIKVYKQPVIGLLSTGNELIEPIAELPPGKIRDSNKTVLKNLFKEQGFPVIDLGIAEDSVEDLIAKVKQGLQFADVLVSTGGVSMGDKDLLKPVLMQHFSATLQFGRVFMKPGLPTTLATTTYENKPKLIFALPGNPVSAAVTSNLFVIPALRKMSGYFQPLQTVLKVKLGSNVQLDPRPEYQRVTLHSDPDTSHFIANVTGKQISCRLLSMTNANGLIILPSWTTEKTCLAEGEEVECMIVGKI